MRVSIVSLPSLALLVAMSAFESGGAALADYSSHTANVGNVVPLQSNVREAREETQDCKERCAQWETRRRKDASGMNTEEYKVCIRKEKNCGSGWKEPPGGYEPCKDIETNTTTTIGRR